MEKKIISFSLKPLKTASFPYIHIVPGIASDIDKDTLSTFDVQKTFKLDILIFSLKHM